MTKRGKNQRYSKQVKLEAIRRVLENDESVQSVVDDMGIRHRDNVYVWIKKYKKNGKSAFERSIGPTYKDSYSASISEEVNALRLEVDALKKYLQILQKGG
ncbi:transposase [Virgibacillus ndiopensis]|uniref:transposase n=1 Tax=Virgibacillus ndiopensis TaxID=2004408 RepID=UPI000C06A5D8|nr:transposase [Virgibacillus ndiopensis]